MNSSDVAKWLATASLARLLSQMVSWACTLIVMRTLRPEDYGSIAIAEAVFTVCLIFVEYPFQVYLVRCSSLAFARRREMFGFALAISVLLGLLMAATAVPVANLYGNQQIALAFMLKAFHLVLMPLKVPYESNLLRKLQFPKHTLAVFAEVLVSALASLALALQGGGVLAILIGPMAGTCARLMVMRSLSGPMGLPVFALKRWKRFSFVLRRLVVNDIFLRLDTPITMLLLGLVLSSKDMGLFSAAQYWAAIPVGRALIIINQISLPVFSHLKKDRRGTLTLIDTFNFYFCFIGIPVFFGLAAVSSEFIVLALGEKWVDASFLFAAMCICMPLRLVRDFALNPLNALAKDVLIKRLHLVHSSLQITLSVIGGILAGAKGAALGLCLGGLADGLIAHHAMCTTLGHSRKTFYKPLVQFTLASLLMFLSIKYAFSDVSTLGSKVLTATQGNLALKLTYMVALGCVAYCLFALLTAPKTCVSTVQTLLNSLRRTR